MISDLRGMATSLSLHPLTQFEHWYQEQTAVTSGDLSSACCLSSIGEDGYPNARFVSLKGIYDRKFVITGPLTSRKARELRKLPKAALTFWWRETDRQVRIQGDALLLDTPLADQLFADRPHSAQLLSHLSEQGQPLKEWSDLLHRLEKRTTGQPKTPVGRPEHWGGFYIVPFRIEFMSFRADRCHLRELYTLSSGRWDKILLQP